MTNKLSVSWVWFAAIFLLCFRPIVAFRIYTPLDDLCYATWAAKFLFINTNACAGGAYPPGAGLLWLPASVLSFFSSGFDSSAFLATLPIWVGLSAFVYWLMSGLLFDSLLFLLSVPVLYYATHRTTLVHAPEIFLAALLVWVSKKGMAWRSLSVAVALTLLRLNDAPALVFPLVLFFGRDQNALSDRSRLWGRVVSVVALLGAASYLVWVGIQGYHSTHVFQLLKRMRFERVAEVFFGGDWGLVFTAPFWIYCFVFALRYFMKLKILTRIAVLWMGFELLICLVWKGNGSDFGYRYLIGSYAGAYLVWCEMREGSFSSWNRFAKWVLYVNAIILFWLTWIYKEFPSVTPYSIAGKTWTHPELLLNSVKALGHPEGYWVPLMHSPVVALFESVVTAEGPYALSSGVRSLSFWTLLTASTLAIFFIIRHWWCNRTSARR